MLFVEIKRYTNFAFIKNILINPLTIERKSVYIIRKKAWHITIQILNIAVRMINKDQSHQQQGPIEY